MTSEERRAIAALKRLARQWPKSLCLVHSGREALLICRTDDSKDPSELELLDAVIGLNVNAHS